MKSLVWRNIGRFVLIMALQLLVLDHVYLGGYIMPMIYLLFVLMLPTGMKRIPLLLIAFGTGLLSDVMTGALGFHALACTVVAMLRIAFADRILTRGEPVVVERPSCLDVTPQYFVAYLAILFASFYLVFFTVELWGARSLGEVLLSTVLSTLLSVVLSVVYQVVFLRKKVETT